MALRKPALSLSTPGQGMMIAMTDLFISATATLLVVLTLARVEKPVPVPVQADLLVLCPSLANQADASSVPVFGLVPRSQAKPSIDGSVTVPASRISNFTDVASLADQIVQNADDTRLFYTLGLVDAAERPLTSACLGHLQSRIVQAYNRSQNAKPDTSTGSGGFVLSLQSIGQRVMVEGAYAR